MRTPDDYAREIVDRWWEPANADDLPAVIVSVLRRALADREAELLAPAAGGEVTPEEVAHMQALLDRTAVSALEPSPVRRALAELRRLWAVMGDVWQDSAMYRHGYMAGWRACRELAAARLEGEAASCRENDALLAVTAVTESYGEVVAANTCERLARDLRATEPPAEGGAG